MEQTTQNRKEMTKLASSLPLKDPLIGFYLNLERVSVGDHALSLFGLVPNPIESSSSNYSVCPFQPYIALHQR